MTLITRAVPAIEAPDPAQREAVHAGPVTEAAYRAALRDLECLHVIEVAPPARPLPPPDRSARIAFWNAERLKYPAPSVELLRGLGADACLLAEVDVGMARSGNRHTIGELARELGAGHLFGVEFVELDLGDARERGWHAGQRNTFGLHGGGIVSPHHLGRPALARLETSGRWFDGMFGERRVGGRIAVMASLDVMGREVLLVSVHYESHTGPEDRAAQTRVLLEAIERHAPGVPVLIGGDFNTSTVGRNPDGSKIEPDLAEDPERLVVPVPYEPMFAHLQAGGWRWEACNVPAAPTQRTRPDGTPRPPHGKIDWFFSRGLRCSRPAIVAAVDGEGVAISDHEVLVVTIEPES